MNFSRTFNFFPFENAAKKELFSRSRSQWLMNQAANSLYPYVDQLMQNDVDADTIAEYLNHHQHLNCLQLVFLHIGHYYRERMRWDEAVQYLEKSKQGNLCCASCLTSSEAAIDDCRGETYVSVIVDICFTRATSLGIRQIQALSGNGQPPATSELERPFQGM